MIISLLDAKAGTIFSFSHLNEDKFLYKNSRVGSSGRNLPLFLIAQYDSKIRFGPMTGKVLSLKQDKYD